MKEGEKKMEQEREHHVIRGRKKKGKRGLPKLILS